MTHSSALGLTFAFLLIAVLALGGVRADGDESSAELKVGAPAPTFRLNDQAGQVVDPIAVARKGERWVILAFFPKALTPG